MSPKPRFDWMQGYLGLACLEGVLALVLLFSLPGSSWFSLSRLAVAAPAALLAAAFAWLALQQGKHPAWADGLHQRLQRNRLYWSLLALCAIVLVLSFNILLLNWRNTDDYVQAYLSRLLPYALWALLQSLQSAAVLRWLRHGTLSGGLQGHRKALLAGALIFVLLLLLAAWMGWTRIGLAPDLIAWGDPGVPILAWQVVLALGIAATGILLVSAVRRLRSRLGDFLICLLLWTGAWGYWGAVPLLPSYFSPQPVLPNHEYYPYSDAAVYDIAAQNLLAGYGLGKEVVRPFYSFFLAVAQASAVGYESVLAWQVPLLALFPVMLYLLGKTLHSRPAGILAGLLGIFQQGNAIALAGAVNVSHAKLLMSDVPTALGVAAFTALLVLWIKAPSRKVYAVLAGGVLALTLLVRVQVIFLLPAALLAASAATLGAGSQPRTQQLLANLGLVAAGFLCVMLPWLWRNWQLSGKVFLSEASQTSQIGLIGQRYNLTIEREAGLRQPGESDDAYSSRMLRSALAFVRQHPGETARFISAHFLHNQVATLLVLPSAYPLLDYQQALVNGALVGRTPKAEVIWRRCCSVRGAVESSPYWNAWDGRFAADAALPLVAALLLISLGMGAAWRGSRLGSMLPLVVGLFYTLSNAVVRNSGWRFNQPVDWVGYVYYAIGLVQVGMWLKSYFRNADVNPLTGGEAVQVSLPSRADAPLLAGLFFFLLSAAIPVAEQAVPPRYAGMTASSVITSLDEKGLLAPLGLDAQALQAFLDQPGAEGMVGLVLYPRYYAAGDGLPGSGWPSFTPRSSDRLGFFLIGPTRRHIVLQTPAPPASFPNASDVLVVGCSQGDYLDAYLVVTLGSPEVLFTRASLAQWACSPQ